MAVDPSARVHASAVVSAEAQIGSNVRVGPFAVIEGEVTIGSDCQIDPHVHLVGPVTIGRGNLIGTGTVIGTAPQHLAYQGQPSRTQIGDANIFREYVTVHRGSHVAGHGVTSIGSNNYFMAAAHVGHDSRVGNHCVLANCALMGGHAEIQDRVFMSGNTSLHQFTRMGRLSLLMGQEGVGRDVPPFLMAKSPFLILGVNLVGMRRAGCSTSDIGAVRQACHILYRSNLLIKQAVERLDQELGSHPLVAEMVKFIRESKRGIVRAMDRLGGRDDAE